MNPRILIIGLVIPEPTSSAAGWRMLQLIEQLKQLSSDIHFATAASKSDRSFPLEQIGVQKHTIVLNDSSFDDFVAQLNPQIVMYDRFMTEEQFGWRVKQMCPKCVTILDTEDLHFVRRARAEAFKKNEIVNYDTADCYRELSAIYRCDLSVIISKVEYDLLINHFQIPEKQLLYLPFIQNEIKEEHSKKLPSFDERKDIIFIGNFIHEPNYQTVVLLKKLWNDLRKQLPETELHVYGAYAPQKVLQLHNENERFIVKGHVDDVDETMLRYRVLFAPIPFGAGLKGKFIDGFKNGLPSVTTMVGAEGMYHDRWGGFVADDPKNMIKSVYTLYQNKEVWKNAVQVGCQIVNRQFSFEKWNGKLSQNIFSIVSNVEQHRGALFVQKILWQNSLQASKYMSLWIEAKNK